MRSLIFGLALLAAGGVAILVGEFPAQDALTLLDRVWPVLLFVVAITIVAELAAAAGLFDIIAAWTTWVARGSSWLLWLLTVAVAIVSTVFLSLDTTAVLLTPIVITMARQVRVNPMPFALTTVMLANCASLLLPVSNLTNLLAEQRLGGGTAGFLALSWAPAIVAVLVPVGVIGFIGRRTLAVRFETTEGVEVPDRRLVICTAVVVLALLPALVSGIPVWIPACVAAAALLAVFLVLRRDAVRPALVPWQTLVLAAGLFVAMGAVNALGLTEVLSSLAGTGTGAGAAELFRTSTLGLVGANAANNLPAYLALEPVAQHPLQVMALLIGVNAGSLITPWASLATLLWHGRLARLGVEVPWGRYMLIGLVVAPVTVAAATGVLALVG
ncbi:MAG TPA: SLC13 family permease [Humibacter sp.]|nr:SLC13 family permease [Humibacter sp.]